MEARASQSQSSELRKKKAIAVRSNWTEIKEAASADAFAASLFMLQNYSIATR